MGVYISGSSYLGTDFILYLMRFLASIRACASVDDGFYSVYLPPKTRKINLKKAKSESKISFFCIIHIWTFRNELESNQWKCISYTIIGASAF